MRRQRVRCLGFGSGSGVWELAGFALAGALVSSVMTNLLSRWEVYETAVHLFQILSTPAQDAKSLYLLASIIKAFQAHLLYQKRESYFN